MSEGLCIRKGTLEALAYVNNNPGCNLASVIEYVGLSPHTAHNRMGDLIRMGWVRKDDRPRVTNSCVYVVTPKGHEAACLVQELCRTLEADG